MKIAVAPLPGETQVEEAMVAAPRTPAGEVTDPALALDAAVVTKQMNDCSNDESGLEMATLEVLASWTSAAPRVVTDMTMVTQMSPGRCGDRGLVRHKHDQPYIYA